MKTNKNKISKKRGVYFLANDKVFDMTIAFLNSFRMHNPEIALCLIPFNDNSERVKALHDKYNFTILDNHQKNLALCDEISRHFHEKTCGAYRKLVMWDGIFDEFIYIDVDTVVLSNVEFVFQFLSDYDVVTSHSNWPILQRFVWKESIYTTNKLSTDQIAYSAITGFIASKKSVLSLPRMAKKLVAAEKLRPHMELECMEQPLLNYYFVTSKCRYTSLASLSYQDLHRGLMYERWAGTKDGFAFRGKIYFNKGNPVLLIHWANCWRPTFFDFWCHEFAKNLGFHMKPHSIRFFMPYKRLWKYYRNMKAPALKHQKKIPSYNQC